MVLCSNSYRPIFCMRQSTIRSIQSWMTGPRASHHNYVFPSGLWIFWTMSSNYVMISGKSSVVFPFFPFFFIKVKVQCSSIVSDKKQKYQQSIFPKMGSSNNKANAINHLVALIFNVWGMLLEWSVSEGHALLILHRNTSCSLI